MVCNVFVSSEKKRFDEQERLEREREREWKEKEERGMIVMVLLLKNYYFLLWGKTSI